MGGASSESFQRSTGGYLPRTNAASLGPFALYLLLIGALFPFFRYLLAPDSISYISIAQHYADGYWSEAINTSWSPLISWLIVPLLWIGVPGVLAAKLVCIASGILLLFGVRILARGFEISPRLEIVMMYTASIMIATFALTRLGPDILVAAILLFYFASIFDRTYGQHRRAGIVCGLLGVAAFLAKGYIFYFFIAHFIAMTVLHWFREQGPDRGRILRHFAIGILIFAAGCAPWIAAMSAKTGRLNFGTTGAWNYRLVGPDSPGYPQYLHLIPPPGPHAISMWEQPSPTLLPAWSPFSGHGLRHQLRLLKANFKELTAILIDTSIFSFAALFAYIVWGIARGEKARYPWPFVLATVVILPGGYLLVLVQDRYIWAALLVILLAGAAVIDSAAGNLNRLAWRVAIAGYALSFLLLPARMLIGERNTGKGWYQESQAIRSQIPTGSRLAGCGAWNDSLAVAFYLHDPFYGSTGSTAEEDPIRYLLNPDATANGTPTPLSSAAIGRTLLANKIRYYLVWPSCRTLPPPNVIAGEIDVPGGNGAKVLRITGQE